MSSTCRKGQSQSGQYGFAMSSLSLHASQRKEWVRTGLILGWLLATAVNVPAALDTTTPSPWGIALSCGYLLVWLVAFSSGVIAPSWIIGFWLINGALVAVCAVLAQIGFAGDPGTGRLVWLALALMVVAPPSIYGVVGLLGLENPLVLMAVACVAWGGFGLLLNALVRARQRRRQ